MNSSSNASLKTRGEDFWRQRLSPDEYFILRMKGTEPPFSGAYTDTLGEGLWVCRGCETALFEGSSKFASSCGWPAFSQAKSGAIDESLDLSHGMKRIEVSCHECGSHLGHVFEDGPPPSGLRYCINSLAIHFKPLTR